jgi:hypothetical protein
LKLNLKAKDSGLSELKQDLVNLVKKLSKSENKNLNQNENIISIAFTTVGHKFILPVLCKKTDTFMYLEAKLCEEYQEYQDGKISFTVDGHKIKKIKTLSENGIKCSDVIIVHKNE